MFEIAYKTYSGAVESHNEDTVFINGKIFNDGFGIIEDENCLVAVFDGVGGEDCGEIASKTAANVLARFVGKSFNEELSDEYAQQANREIKKIQSTDIKCRNMATTVVSLYISADDVLCFNLGDSEAYRYRFGSLYLLSENHSVDSLCGISFEGNQEQRSHIIAKYIGGEYMKPYFFDGYETFDEKDIFILFSDGVGDTVTKKEIKNCIKEHDDLLEICKTLAQLAVDNGSTDNISIIVLRRKNG